MSTLTCFRLSLFFITSLMLTACDQAADDHGHSHGGEAVHQHDEDHGYAHDEKESAPETEAFYGDETQPVGEQASDQIDSEAEAAEHQHDHARGEHDHNH